MDKKNRIFDDQKTELISHLKEIQRLQNLVEKTKLDKQDQFEELILGVIDVIDTYEQAENTISERNLNDSDNSKLIISRFNSVLNKLHRLLKSFGVTKLEFPEKRLIIGFCKVIDTEPDSQLPNDTIIEVVRNGYIFGKQPIREAEVIIVKN